MSMVASTCSPLSGISARPLSAVAACRLKLAEGCLACTTAYILAVTITTEKTTIMRSPNLPSADRPVDAAGQQHEVSGLNQCIWRIDLTKMNQHQVTVDQTPSEAPGDLIEHGHWHLAFSQASQEVFISLGM